MSIMMIIEICVRSGEAIGDLIQFKTETDIHCFFAVSSSVSTFQCPEHCIIYGMYTVYINMFSNKGLFMVID